MSDEPPRRWQNPDHEQLHSALVQIATELAGLRAAVMFAIAPPKAAKAEEPTVPERCAGVPADRCAMQDEDARVARRSFEDLNGWQCKGCRIKSGEAGA